MTDNNNRQKETRWAIIGAGNGGQSMAGHLGIEGYSVRLYDVFESTIKTINDKKGIEVQGEINGFGPVELATTNIQQALEGANLIVVVLPAVYHKDIARSCAPFLKDNQIIILHPGATFGALEFKKVLEDEKCTADVIISESLSLIYACRAEKPGFATIFGIKKSLKLAAIPASATPKVLELLNPVFPQFEPARNILETSLGNLNSMMHPGPTLLNTGRIDSQTDFLYYWEGITPVIGDFVEQLDVERMDLAKALGLDIPTLREAYKDIYGVSGESLHDTVRANQAYAGIKGQKTLDTRYLTEDIPTGLYPMVSLGKLLGVSVARMETLVKLSEYLLKKDLTSDARSVHNLGLDKMTAQQIVHYAETGQRS
ncbi:MAG: NADP transhydrogenase subunit alpha [Deltaproteobacteria bacterium]|nr:NADP transhydrogenase subunit alpha [Deltaproteobacteria bacterium]